MQVNTKYPRHTVPNGRGVAVQYNGDCLELQASEIIVQAKNFQVRKKENDAAHINDLAEDIRAYGLKKPIIVSIDNNGKILLQSGHHRLAACRDILKLETVPCYSLSFNSERSRLEFLQEENNHRPAKPHTKEDAVYYLDRLKEIGTFEGLDEDARKQVAAQHLKRHYKQFSHGNTINSIYGRWKNSNGEGNTREYRGEKGKKTRTDFAAIHGFNNVAPSTYCLANNCWFVSTNTGNALKNVATINFYGDAPEAAQNPQIVVFTNTGAKTHDTIDLQRAKFIEEMKKVNSRNPTYPVKKIVFLPDLLDDLETFVVEL